MPKQSYPTHLEKKHDPFTHPSMVTHLEKNPGKQDSFPIHRWQHTYVFEKNPGIPILQWLPIPQWLTPWLRHRTLYPSINGNTPKPLRRIYPILWWQHTLRRTLGHRTWDLCPIAWLAPICIALQWFGVPRESSVHVSAKVKTAILIEQPQLYIT